MFHWSTADRQADSVVYSVALLICALILCTRVFHLHRVTGLHCIQQGVHRRVHDGDLWLLRDATGMADMRAATLRTNGRAF